MRYNNEEFRNRVIKFPVYDENIYYLSTLFISFINNLKNIFTNDRIHNINYNGNDIDNKTIKKIKRILNNNGTDKFTIEEMALFSELSFWREISINGYGGNDPRLFKYYQQVYMLQHFFKTGWSILGLKECSIVEIGCGPLGMIEALPGRRRVGIDPLNNYYDVLFSKVRSRDVEYYKDLTSVLKHPKTFDLLICFNVLDHSTNPKKILADSMKLLKNNGRFIIQVNTIKNGYEPSQIHKKMHPSPITAEQIRSWLDEYSSNYYAELADEPTLDNEFYFFANGHISK